MTPLETEMAEARILLERIKDGTLTMRLSRNDVTQREGVLLEREIAAIERTLGYATDARDVGFEG
jgi:hypothetical protein